MGAVTVVIRKRTGFGVVGKMVVADVTFSGTYGAGGDTFTAKQFEMGSIDGIIPLGPAVGSATTGYEIMPDLTGLKLRLLGGAASGVASGDGEGPRIAGVAVVVGEVCPGVALTGAGLGAICFARYTSHTTSPTTQRATTIHAVRSINSVLHDQTQRRISF